VRSSSVAPPTKWNAGKFDEKIQGGRVFLSVVSFAETYPVQSLEARCWEIRGNFNVVAETENERLSGNFQHVSATMGEFWKNRYLNQNLDAGRAAFRTQENTGGGTQP
jgi:hypothetical protein